MKAQSCSGLNIQFQSDIPSLCTNMTMTMIHDGVNRPFLYVANKEAGLKIYDVASLSSPVLIATVPTSMFDSLDVMSLSQSGHSLFLAIGNTFTNPQAGGLAIVDVSNPFNPVLTDYFIVPGSGTGAGVVKVEGSYAYLGAMGSGLVILDVSNISNIQFVSGIVPDINFPPITNPDTTKINARGLEVINSIVYLCDDAGGFRIINCTDKLHPIETGHFCNPLLYLPFNLPRAYNNVVIQDTLAYIAVDYCGMEILNIADTSHITLTGWWNPYNCPNNNWFTSPVHANEIQLDPQCGLVFLSTGKSDLQVIDVSNPFQPDSCNFYGGVSNNIGTWGAGRFQNQIYLAYICVPFPNIPFPSNWTGVKILTYTSCQTGISEIQAEDNLDIFPSPAGNYLTIYSNDPQIDLKKYRISICNLIGQQMHPVFRSATTEAINLNLEELKDGIYFIAISGPERVSTKRFIKNSY